MASGAPAGIGGNLVPKNLPGGGELEGVPGQVLGGGWAGEGGRQIPGVIIQQVDRQAFGVVDQQDAGGVDLPQVRSRSLARTADQPSVGAEKLFCWMRR